MRKVKIDFSEAAIKTKSQYLFCSANLQLKAHVNKFGHHSVGISQTSRQERCRAMECRPALQVFSHPVQQCDPDVRKPTDSLFQKY